MNTNHWSPRKRLVASGTAMGLSFLATLILVTACAPVSTTATTTDEVETSVGDAADLSTTTLPGSTTLLSSTTSLATTTTVEESTTTTDEPSVTTKPTTTTSEPTTTTSKATTTTTSKPTTTTSKATTTTTTTVATTTTTAPPTTTTTVGPVTHVVSMGEYFFSPPNLTITVADKVRWVNNGGEPHTSTSGTQPSSNGIWDSDLLMPGSSFTWTFNSAGTFNYFCSIHTGQTGVITVNP